MLGKDEILYILMNKNSNLSVTVYTVVQKLWPWTELYWIFISPQKLICEIPLLYLNMHIELYHNLKVTLFLAEKKITTSDKERIHICVCGICVEAFWSQKRYY